jgi:hypothetical protein
VRWEPNVPKAYAEVNIGYTWVGAPHVNQLFDKGGWIKVVNADKTVTTKFEGVEEF